MRGFVVWAGDLVEVRPDERRPAALMLAYGFLAMAAFYVLKPVRKSVFVDRVGADNLSYVYVATALVVGTLMVGYSRAPSPWSPPASSSSGGCSGPDPPI